MERASKDTYISQNFIEKYNAKKQKLKQKKMMQEQKTKSSSVQEEKSRGNSSKSDSEGDEQLNRSYEYINQDDLENDLNGSGDEMSCKPTHKAKHTSSKAKQNQHPQVFRQEVDTNVFEISMATLKDGAELASGDPYFCKTCQAVFNSFSKAEDNKEGGDESQLWVCEFCLTKQEVNFEPEELPKTSAVNYILEASAQVNEKQMLGKQEISVVFCIDISGSMCVSKPVTGKHTIKGDKSGGLNDLMKFSDGSDQRMQGEANITYVSRMQCVQAAIDSQLTEMSSGAPGRKIGLVTFNGEVTIIGDGSQTDQQIAGDKLNDYDFLKQNGQTEGNKRMQASIKDTKAKLQQKLMSLEETGPTALGPALTTAISMAAQGTPGSAVVLCTDGLSNVGLGAFEEINSEQEYKKVEEFYECLGEFAKNKGVTVNIISIEGEECNIDTLSKLSEVTGGSVERVDPIQLTQNFANILSVPVIATNVVTKVKLHKGLEFRNEEEANLSEDKSLIVKQLGNVTEETDITFEFRLKSMKELLKMEDLDLNTVKSLPFQAQITYNALDGSKCIRVITSHSSISNDRQELERNANYAILSTNAIQQSSKLAKRGQMREAQCYAKAWNRKMRTQKNNVEQEECFENYQKHFGGVYNMIAEAQQVSEEDEEEHASQQQMAGGEINKEESKKHEKARAKKSGGGFFKRMKDDISTQLYKGSKMNNNRFRE